MKTFRVEGRVQGTFLEFVVARSAEEAVKVLERWGPSLERSTLEQSIDMVEEVEEEEDEEPEVRRFS